MFRPIGQPIFPTITFTMKGDRGKRNDHIINNNEDIGPLVSNDLKYFLRPWKIFWLAFLKDSPKVMVYQSRDFQLKTVIQFYRHEVIIIAQ